jgi:hypothetical protein
MNGLRHRIAVELRSRSARAWRSGEAALAYCLNALAHLLDRRGAA